MELHQGQAQHDAYSAMAICLVPLLTSFSGYAPPPLPGEQPPPPPDGQQPTAPQGEQQNTAEAYAAYWAQYGYDVNSPQFKEWAATQQQQQYNQYYAQAGYNGVAPEGDAQPQPPQQAPPPPPPPS